MSDIQELRDYLAEKVMGWRYDKDWYGVYGEYPYWYAANGEPTCRLLDWHPDTDANQALMCVLKLLRDYREARFKLEIPSPDSLHRARAYFTLYSQLPGEGRANGEAWAISLACRAFKQRMEAQDA